MIISDHSGRHEQLLIENCQRLSLDCAENPEILDKMPLTSRGKHICDMLCTQSTVEKAEWTCKCAKNFTARDGQYTNFVQQVLENYHVDYEKIENDGYLLATTTATKTIGRNRSSCRKKKVVCILGST